MALTTAQQVRLKIQDQPTIFDDVYYSDGSGSAFNLPYLNITSASAFVTDDNAQWSATGCNFNASGYVTFSGIITASSAWRARGVQSVFSDAEIGHFTAVGGSVDGAAIEAIEALMFDGVKRAVWRAPDGSMYDDTRAMEHLRKMYDQLTSALADDAIAGGGMQSWATGQQYYP